MQRAVLGLFRAAFGETPRAAASAPGRVNLIGEHTDYNGGPVLPLAVEARTTVAVGPADDGILELVSAQTSENGRPKRVAWREATPAGWPAYLVGVMRELWTAEALPKTGGARVAVTSDLPMGAGLSSSAALTVAASKALLALAGTELTARQVAGVAFRAETNHVGVRCGIMDQTIAGLARRGHALLLECASLATRQVPFAGRLLVVHTGANRRLARSAYNERRAECEAAVTRLKVELPELIWLASWPVEWLARLKKALPQPLRSRAVHVVSETARVRYAAQLLERGRLKQFGALLYESHESLRRYYDCSTPELDLVVQTAKRAGSLGAKLSGAGWGGSVIVLLGKGDGGRGKGGSRVADAVRRAFKRKFGREPVIMPVSASGGVREEKV